jgi:hypothetical protein
VAVVACDTLSGPRPVIVGAPAELSIVSGQDQHGIVAAMLPTTLRVRLTDSSGHPISGFVINFKVTAGGGSVFAGSAATNADGTALERWTLGSTAADSQKLEARAVDQTTGEPIVFATFQATAEPDTGSAIVTVAPDSISVVVGDSTQYSATVADAFGNAIQVQIVWTTDDSTIALVDSTGLSVALAAGTTTLRASAAAHLGTSSIEVFPNSVDTIAVGSARDALDGTAVDVDSDRELYAIAYNRFGRALRDRVITWSSADTAIATVSSTALGDTAQAHGVAKGTVLMSATSEGRTSSILVHVVRLILDPADPALTVGDSVSVAIREVPGGERVCRNVGIEWSSSDSSVATVGRSQAAFDEAYVKAVGPGSATIRGTCNLGSSGYYGTGKTTVIGSSP